MKPTSGWSLSWMKWSLQPTKMPPHDLSIALHGKGAFRRFKDTLHSVDDQWLQAWYQWKQTQLEAAIDEWLKNVSSLQMPGSQSGFGKARNAKNTKRLKTLVEVLAQSGGSSKVFGIF
jgi:hypothetical protein